MIGIKINVDSRKKSSINRQENRKHGIRLLKWHSKQRELFFLKKL